MRLALLALLLLPLSGCYTIPVGTPECNAVYDRVYLENFKGEDAPWWAIVFAHNAFDKCMGKNG
jgi:hypothetical protein